MALQTVLEKLQLKDEKNILVQGLPSSIEKQFLKLSFAKAVTPLLRTRRIDFALVFAISKSQLCGILKDVIPALHPDAKLWVAYPKLTSKIASDLCRDCNWDMISAMGFDTNDLAELDSTWNAVQFTKQHTIAPKKASLAIAVDSEPADRKSRAVSIPAEFKTSFRKNKEAGVLYEGIAVSPKREYVEWISDTKRSTGRTKKSTAAK